MTNRAPIWAAAAGGTAPTLLGLAVSMVQPGAQWPTFTFVFGVLLYATLGAVVGWVSAERDLRKAFFLGIGLPALINSGVGSATERESKLNQPNAQVRTWGLISSAYAAEPVSNRTNALASSTNAVSASDQSSRTNVTLSIALDEKLGEVWLLAKDARGAVIKQMMIDPGSKATVALPIATTQVDFRGEQFESKSQALRPVAQQATVFELEARRDIWSGFKKALGVRNVKEYGLTVKTNP